MIAHRLRQILGSDRQDIDYGKVDNAWHILQDMMTKKPYTREELENIFHDLDTDGIKEVIESNLDKGKLEGEQSLEDIRSAEEAANTDRELNPSTSEIPTGQNIDEIVEVDYAGDMPTHFKMREKKFDDLVEIIEENWPELTNKPEYKQLLDVRKNSPKQAGKMFDNMIEFLKCHGIGEF